MQGGEKEYYLATAAEEIYVAPTAQFSLRGFKVAGARSTGQLVWDSEWLGLDRRCGHGPQSVTHIVEQPSDRWTVSALRLVCASRPAVDTCGIH